MRSRSPRSVDSAPDTRRRSRGSAAKDHPRPVGASSRQGGIRQASGTRDRAGVAPKPSMAVGAATMGKQDLVCSLIGLGVKVGLVMVTGVSLVRLASAYQERMDRQGELAAVLQIESAQLTKAQQRFDRLFLVSGEKTLAREQSQWIAPNRLRVVWQAPPAAAQPTASPKVSATGRAPEALASLKPRVNGSGAAAQTATPGNN